MMAINNAGADYDPNVMITDFAMVEQLGDAVLVGNWFMFLKPEWLERAGLARVLELSGVESKVHAAVVFRGKETIMLPSAHIAPTTLPTTRLVSLTCDKALYRAKQDTVRLLIAVPQQLHKYLRLKLRLSGNAYADYPITLDEFGLYLWSLQGLPEGSYEASLEGLEGEGSVERREEVVEGDKGASVEAEVCRFEVAEYRLAPLNAELTEQQLSGETLRYVLAVTAFGQPYSGSIEVELEERGQRVGHRTQLHCGREGQCRGAVKLIGKGPFTLHVFVGERTASVAIKGSEQERREVMTISELGELRTLSLLPMPQSNACRGMYIARGGSNTEPFVVQRVIGNEVEITARADAEMLRVVVVDPARNTFEEKVYEQLKSGQSVHHAIAAPYGMVLLGAFIGGSAWEGWTTVLRPPMLQVQCEAPKEAKPGARVTVRLKTNMADRIVPVQLIVKDQRLTAPSDPLVEFAACIKKSLNEWSKLNKTGKVERQLSQLGGYRMRNPYRPHMVAFARMAGQTMATSPMSPQPMTQAYAVQQGVAPMAAMSPGVMQPAAPVASMVEGESVQQAAGMRVHEVKAVGLGERVVAPNATPMLTKMRLQFPEIVYNDIVRVQGEVSVEVKLGDSMTRYSIEAFALVPDTLDWQRVETTLQTTQPVFGELTVSPFVYPGDPVMGRLDVGAASGGAMVEVRSDGEALPLFYENGEAVAPGLPIPSGSVIRFPVRAGAITSSVRDARKGGIDVSERYVTEPGKMRHIVRRLHLLTAGDELRLREGRRLEILPMPGLEKPFQVFVEAAAQYPFGCVEQTSTKLLAMITGYISNQDHEERAREYEAVIPVWYKRLQSMYLPNSGFCMYPPSEGGASRPDTHYAPQAVKYLLSLPTKEQAQVRSLGVCEMLDEIRATAEDGARYYKIEQLPKKIEDCQAAYEVMTKSASSADRERAVAYVRTRLKEHDGQIFVEISDQSEVYKWFGKAVARRRETAYAAATLLATKEQSDLRMAIAATNYLTGQINEEGRLYSTTDTAACLALFLGLREAGIGATAQGGRVVLNGEEMALADALSFDGRVEMLRCVEGVVAAQVTSEVVEDWSAYKGQIPVTVQLEKNGHVQTDFKVGDAVDLVIRVPKYEPGLIAHVCLPDALARVVGGGQVKRFSLDFCEQNTLRVPLAVISATSLPMARDEEQHNSLLRWLGVKNKGNAENVQHWAVIVRNMFKEEQVGNPGLLGVRATV